MGEFILNLLPLKENEKDWFEDAAPGAVHVYAGRYTVRQEDLEQATVIIGWPLRRDVRKAKNLRWLHTMWSGADEYLKRPMPVRSSLLLSSSRGANSQAVADYMLTSMLALFYRLELYRDHQRAHEWVDEGEIKTVPASEILVAGAGNVGRRMSKRRVKNIPRWKTARQAVLRRGIILVFQSPIGAIFSRYIRRKRMVERVMEMSSAITQEYHTVWRPHRCANSHASGRMQRSWRQTELIRL